jgi:hypothetical protein
VRRYGGELPRRIAGDVGVITGSPIRQPHNEDRTIDVRINLVTLGDAQILTIPAAALPNIVSFLRRKMHGKHKMLFGLTNEAFGYLLTKVGSRRFARYDCIIRICLGEMAGEILIEKALDLVNKAKSPSK